MRILLIVIALTLPVVVGERSWPWWLVLVSGALAFLGFFKANYGRIEIVDGRGGIPRVIASALAAISATVTDNPDCMPDNAWSMLALSWPEMLMRFDKSPEAIRLAISFA